VIMCVLFFGGASPWQVVQVAMLTGAAAFLAAAIGFFFSTTKGRKGSPEVVALLVVGLLYSNLGYSLVSLVLGGFRGALWNPAAFWGFWLAPPFALSTVMNPSGPMRTVCGMSPWAVSLFASLAFGALIVAAGVLRVRRSEGGRGGVPARKTSRLRKKRRLFRRPVLGGNIILWREMAGRIRGRFDSIGKLGYVGLVIGLYVLMFILNARYGSWGMDSFFWTLFVLELAVLFLAALAVAGRSILSERSDPTFTLLLATPIAARSIVLGKVKAIFRHLAVFIAMPVANVVIMVIAGRLRAEALLSVPLSIMVALFVFVAGCVFFSLYCRKLRGVVGWTVLVQFLLNGGLLWLLSLILLPLFFLSGAAFGGGFGFMLGLAWAILALSPFYWVGMGAGGAAFGPRSGGTYLLFTGQVGFGGYFFALLAFSVGFALVSFWLLHRVSRRLDAKFDRCV